MDVLVADLLQVAAVLLCTDPCKALLVNEALQRVDRGDQDVDSQVKFIPVQQERLVNVLLHYDRLAENHLLEFVNQGNSSASRQTHRLQDPDVLTLCLRLSEFSDEGQVLTRQEECLGDDVEVLTEFLGESLHLLNIFLQQVLPGELLAPKEVVDLLENNERVEIDLGFRPGPEQVPTALQVHSVGQLEPVVSPIERGVYNVVDLAFGLHYSIEKEPFL